MRYYHAQPFEDLPMRSKKSSKKSLRFDLKAFLASGGHGGTIVDFPKKQTPFSQGDPADAVFYILKGKITLSVLSRQGKEAVIAMFGADDFFGEGCLAGQRLRMATATTTADSSIDRKSTPLNS